MLKYKQIIVLIYTVGAFLIFNNYAYDIYKFNDRIRVFITTGKLDVRTFNNHGIPISHSRRVKRYISPFYVVHYGILYSENIKTDKLSKKIQWKKDPSLSYWNVELPYIDKEKSRIYMKNSLDWLVDNLVEVNGKAHFIYNFDWYYKGYPNEELTKGWWSGLTDSYAIVLFLRGYDIFKNEKYLDIAKKLYASVLTNFNQYGSLTRLNNNLWIEEYVDPRNINTSNKMAYVLNGMIYSTYSILTYETYFGKNKYGKELLKSLQVNIPLYLTKSWLKYDLLGGETNVKYFLISKSLIERLHDDGLINGTNITSAISEINSLNSMLAVNYILFGEKSYSWVHFLFTFIFVVFAPIIYLFTKRFFR